MFCVLLVLPPWAGASVCSPSSLAQFSGVLGIISGSPAGGITIGPILVSARHTTTVSFQGGAVYSSLLDSFLLLCLYSTFPIVQRT